MERDDSRARRPAKDTYSLLGRGLGRKKRYADGEDEEGQVGWSGGEKVESIVRKGDRRFVVAVAWQAGKRAGESGLGWGRRRARAGMAGDSSGLAWLAGALAGRARVRLRWLVVRVCVVCVCCCD